MTYNWVKRSIFWELFYWKINLLRYNLDVMHIKRTCLNIFLTRWWTWKERQRTI
jgi:hypothetical protein